MLATGALVLLLLPSSAAAGGWWSSIQLEQATVAPGQEVQIRATEVLFESVEAADRARTVGYFAYVLYGLDEGIVRRAMTKADPGRWWTPGGAELFRAGPIELAVPEGSNLATATGRVRIPDLSAGRYALMLCDAGCRRPLADVVPADLTVVPDAFTATLAARVERLESRAARARGLRASSVELRRVGAASWWVYGGWLFAGAVLGGVGALLVRGRRRVIFLRASRLLGVRAREPSSSPRARLHHPDEVHLGGDGRNPGLARPGRGGRAGDREARRTPRRRLRVPRPL